MRWPGGGERAGRARRVQANIRGRAARAPNSGRNPSQWRALSFNFLTMQRATTDLPAPPLRQLQAWLASEPAAELAVEVPALAFAARGLGRLSLGGEAVLELLLALDARVLDAAERLKPAALQAALPLPEDLRAEVVGLTGALMSLVEVYEEVVEQAWRLDGESAHAGADLLTGQALRLLREAYLMSCLAARAIPYGLWLRAHALGRLGLAAEERGIEAPSAVIAYKHLLCLAAAHPEGLSARELLWLENYLLGLASLARLDRREGGLEPGAFLIDAGRDLGPIPSLRVPDATGKRLCLSAAGLVRRVGEQLDWLRAHVDRDAGIAGDVSALAGVTACPDLPDGLALAEQMVLLRVLRERWTRPPLRGQQRRPERHSAQLCAGLGAIWEQLHQPQAQVAVSCEVVNESDGGYGVTSAAAGLGALEKGMPIALRYAPGQPWVLCVARWIRVDAGNIEFGLQTLGPVSAAVSVGFPRGLGEAVRALLLPPMVGVRRQAALLAPAGTYAGRKFTLLQEGEGVYVAEAHLLSLELQTALCEVFQFQVDPYSE